MSLFFSGAATSSPIRRWLRSSPAHWSPDASLLSPDSSYVCYTAEDGAPSVWRRLSPRLLTNGYYAVTDDSFLRDDDGNVSLGPCAAVVSYKENLFRVFRRRRRKSGGASLTRPLSDVNDSHQTWTDESILAGVLRRDQEPWTKEPIWPVDDDGGCDFFAYDPCRKDHPGDKEAPPPKRMIQEEIGSEICQGIKRPSPSLDGLSEVPPPPVFHGAAWRHPRQHTQSSGSFLLLTFLVLVSAMFVSAGGATGIAASVLTAICGVAAVACLCDRGRTRRTKTEDITSRNE